MIARKFTLALLSGTALTFAGAAYAADVYAPPPEPAYVPAAATPFNWTGLHFGLGVGGQFDFATGDTESYEWWSSTGAYADANLGAASFFGTAEIGYDFQMGHLVLGIGANYDWHPSPGTASFSGSGTDPSDYVSATVKWGDAWAVTGRLGFLATPTTLLYALAGYGQKHISAESFYNLDGDYSGDYGGGLSYSGWIGGWIVGAGLEQAIGSHSTIKIEYRYAQYGSLGSDAGCQGCQVGEVQNGGDFEELFIGNTASHTIRGVFSYHF